MGTGFTPRRYIAVITPKWTNVSNCTKGAWFLSWRTKASYLYYPHVHPSPGIRRNAEPLQICWSVSRIFKTLRRTSRLCWKLVVGSSTREVSRGSIYTRYMMSVIASMWWSMEKCISPIPKRRFWRLRRRVWRKMRPTARGILRNRRSIQRPCLLLLRICRSAQTSLRWKTPRLRNDWPDTRVSSATISSKSPFPLRRNSYSLKESCKSSQTVKASAIWATQTEEVQTQ